MMPSITVATVRDYLKARFPIGTNAQNRIVLGESVDDETLLAAMSLGLLALFLYLFPTGETQPGPLPTQPEPGVPQPAPTPDPPASGPMPDPLPTAPVTTADGADAIDLASAEFTGGLPEQVRSWPITTSLTITSLAPITPVGARESWPDVIPPGFEGPIQYTVCAFVPIGGRWIGSGFIEMWRGRPDCGADPFGGDPARQLAENWFYIAPGMAGYYPPAGSQVAFMLVAGDARAGKGPFVVAERSNLVLVTLP